jgi:hypothetical protein
MTPYPFSLSQESGFVAPKRPYESNAQQLSQITSDRAEVLQEVGIVKKGYFAFVRSK